ncbi:MAG: hypothetical protein KJ970_14695 [Candidatus Eisenbacteria bacterium]|uniref:Flagellar biosynthesis protein FlhF n=1 Tax=Eiseniibacteriota bacterium TaxID=2212470 RepID=A0A948W4F8_UNCEI|nr:hypothetical protein [Candidatus Eisenbacteria bacterium]
MAGALSKVRESLGPDALILETKKTPASSRRPAQVVVLAASDPGPDLPPKPVRGPASVSALPIASSPMTRTAPDTAGLQMELDKALDKIRYLSRLVSSDHFSHLTPWAREIYLDLIESDVDSSLALGILKILPPRHHGSADTAERLRRHIRSLVRVGGEIMPDIIHPQIIVMVGGPGVGKTTTCAKLAARIRDAGHPVGLLSLDTIRLAGALHLNSYAEVLGLPSAIAYSPEEVEEALEGLLSSMTTIIVDTPGIQWTDPEGVRRLKPLLAAMPGAQVHVLLAVSMRVRDQVRYVGTFRSLEPKAITFTKIDETDSYGCLFTTPLKASLPIAYLSDGQRVPDDLRVADTEEIVDLVLDGIELIDQENETPTVKERMTVHDTAITG